MLKDAGAIESAEGQFAERPLVSVVIPTYNHAKFLRQAITSALSQTYQPSEVIVIDDGSTDDTPNVAAQFHDQITYLSQTNQGLSVARNTGILRARGEFIQLLDSDDELCPDTLNTLVDAVIRRPQGSVFFASWDEIDLGGRVTAHVDAKPLPSDTFHALFDPMAIGPPCRYLVRRSAFARVGIFDSRLHACEDWEMWLRMASEGLEFVAEPSACSRYRNYSVSMSKNHELMWRSGTSVLDGAARRHMKCHACRLAKRRGIKRWRDWCYQSMLAPQLRSYKDLGRYDLVGQSCIRALRRDPWIMAALARSAWSQVTRAGGRSVGK